MESVLLNVGCGPKNLSHPMSGFKGWKELRLEIDPGVEPDLVGTMTDLSVLNDATTTTSNTSIRMRCRWPWLIFA